MVTELVLMQHATTGDYHLTLDGLGATGALRVDAWAPDGGATADIERVLSSPRSWPHDADWLDAQPWQLVMATLPIGFHLFIRSGGTIVFAPAPLWMLAARILGESIDHLLLSDTLARCADRAANAWGSVVCMVPARGRDQVRAQLATVATVTG